MQLIKDLKKDGRSGQDGQSLVEFAVALVFLLLLIAGIVDVSRALFTYMALRDAAQEGALYGSTNPLDTGGIT
ncbi:TadE/TadG family type IV pilus assembly protein, partial [Chloroflexota bacterium]